MLPFNLWWSTKAPRGLKTLSDNILPWWVVLGLVLREANTASGPSKALQKAAAGRLVQDQAKKVGNGGKGKACKAVRKTISNAKSTKIARRQHFLQRVARAQAIAQLKAEGTECPKRKARRRLYSSNNTRDGLVQRTQRDFWQRVRQLKLSASRPIEQMEQGAVRSKTLASQCWTPDRSGKSAFRKPWGPILATLPGWQPLFTPGKIQSHLLHTKDSAPGLDGVPYAAWRLNPQVSSHAIYRLFKRTLDSQSHSRTHW